MNNKIALSSLSMDLKRIALAIHNGSQTTAEKFSAEAQKRISEIDSKTLAPYMQKIILKLNSNLPKSKNQKIAEDFLMYSTLLQNYCLKYKNF